jgi:hypothetical protein
MIRSFPELTPSGSLDGVAASGTGDGFDAVAGVDVFGDAAVCVDVFGDAGVCDCRLAGRSTTSSWV